MCMCVVLTRFLDPPNRFPGPTDTFPVHPETFPGHTGWFPGPFLMEICVKMSIFIYIYILHISPYLK